MKETNLMFFRSNITEIKSNIIHFLYFKLMGGKKKEEPSNKTKQKVQNKIIEDKTFGLKNKNKSKVVQK